MIGGRLMFMSFPPLVSEWVALGSLASSSVGLTHCPGRCGVFAGVFLAPNPVKIGEIWSFFGSPIQEMMRLAVDASVPNLTTSAKGDVDHKKVYTAEITPADDTTGDLTFGVAENVVNPVNEASESHKVMSHSKFPQLPSETAH